MSAKQSVCITCGYNMIGEMPDICPFCGSRHDHFLDWEETEITYRVTSNRVSDFVTQLISVPALGLEHAAYRIETDDRAFWIDCPSAFNRNLKRVTDIFFTHPHFMGASNQYRELWQSKVFLHALDAENPLIQSFPVDERFTGDFIKNGLEAFHIGGHTPGYTIYIYHDVLFICDYAFPPGLDMRLNPHGPENETLMKSKLILEIIKARSLETVCGYNYVARFREWLPNFERIVLNKV